MVPLPAAVDLRRRLVVLGNGYLSLGVTWVSSAWSRVGRGEMKVSPHLLYHPGSSLPLSPGSPMPSSSALGCSLAHSPWVSSWLASF